MSPRETAQMVAADCIEDAEALHGKRAGDAMGEMLAQIRVLALLVDHLLEQLDRRTQPDGS